MPWFNYHQNNSGGVFDGPINVIIEADDYVEANSRAENEVGLYFDGCEKDMDCECCGDRWYRMSEYEKGDPEPMIYDRKVEDYAASVDADLYRALGGGEPLYKLYPKSV